MFVHGVLVNANLWRKVVAELSDDFRCVTLDLPFGSHVLPMPPDADLSPPAVADLIADAIAALELDDVTLVGNDSGGGDLPARRHAAPGAHRRAGADLVRRVRQLPPEGAAAAQAAALERRAAAAAARARARGRRPARDLQDGRQAAGRARGARVLRAAGDHQRGRAARPREASSPGIEPSHTLEAAEQLPAFDQPGRDRLVARGHRSSRASDGERLAELLPQGRLEWIDDARTFSPEDQPARVGRLVASVSAAVPAR